MTFQINEVINTYNMNSRSKAYTNANNLHNLKPETLLIYVKFIDDEKNIKKKELCIFISLSDE